MAQHLDKEHGVSPTTEQPTAPCPVLPHRAPGRPWARRRGPGLCLLAAVLLGAVGAAAAGMAVPAPASAANWAPVHPTDFPDPSILLYQGEYYAFATQSFAPEGGATNIQVSTSTNGTSWSELSQDALPQLGSWAVPGDTWAPSVAFNGSVFVMYYTATEASNPGDQCIGVATSSSPFGPYTDTNTTPVVCQDGVYFGFTYDNGNYGGSIDPDIFQDPATGDNWLIWKSDGNHIGVSTLHLVDPALLQPPVHQRVGDRAAGRRSAVAEQHRRGS